MKILVFPAWQQNPYINSLYLLAAGRNAEIVRVTQFGEFQREAERLGPGDLIHIHWTSQILQNGLHPRECEARISLIDHLLGKARGRGVLVFWTIHNKLSHETVSEEMERKLGAILIANANRVIQISRGTADAVADIYTIPVEKLATIPHSSYVGVYPEEATPQSARTILGIEPDRLVIGLVGQLRPYKGLNTLIKAVSEIADQQPTTLVLAGKVNGVSQDELVSMLPTNAQTITSFGFVEDSDLQYWFRAMDVSVFPYRRILNSGSVFLSATFGVPSVLPAEPALVTEFGDEPWVGLYDPNAPSVSAAISEQVSELAHLGADAQKSARQYAVLRPPYRMAKTYLDLVDSERRSAQMPATR